FSIAPPPTLLSTLSLHDALPIYLISLLRERRLSRSDALTERVHFFTHRTQLDFVRLLCERRFCRCHALFDRIDFLAEGGEFDLRSEEHTSELQSRENLVCRLLLE